MSYYFLSFLNLIPPRIGGLGGQKIEGKNPKTLCPHPQPLSQIWERGEENTENIFRQVLFFYPVLGNYY